MKKQKQIWELAKSIRNTWEMNPATKVVPDKTKYNRKKQKQKWKRELY
ncbi:MAG: hypothetical protein FWC68_00465 [Oscillospiraceae bacterium]|nr:hypothetical protein [Oscillospiraceae bacterium]